MTNRNTAFYGRLLLSMAAVFTAVSPFLADWNDSHIYNPLWLPHAKFHNAQTMVLSVMLGVGSIFFTWRRETGERSSVVVAALFGSFYWVSQALAFTFPGVGWTDPNLLPPGKSMSSLPIQAPLILIVLAFVGAGFAMALRDTGNGRESKA